MLILSQKNRIDAIFNKGKEEAWRLTSFYGEPMTHKRNLLHQLINQMSLPWICAGDFNELLKSSKKLKGSTRGRSQMYLFRDVIDECGFLDLSFIGANGHSVWERLDWAFANNDWFLIFTRTRKHHLNANSSDHCPLWIIPDRLDHPCISKPFRFEIWLLDKGCTKTVKAVWLSPDCLDPSKQAV